MLIKSPDFALKNRPLFAVIYYYAVFVIFPVVGGSRPVFIKRSCSIVAGCTRKASVFQTQYDTMFQLVKNCVLYK